MHSFRLTLKNYRCFTDEKPLNIEFGPGFSAFIGCNNAGKSSALRFFYELRHVWPHFGSGSIASNLRAAAIGVGAGVIQDPDEVFTNLNKRDLEIELHFTNPDSSRYIRQLKITFGRNNWGTANCEFRSSDGALFRPTSNDGWSQNGSIVNYSNAGQIDVSSISGVMDTLSRTLYVGAYRNAINQGAGTYYDLQVGTGLVGLWNAWKVGGTRAQMDKIIEITETIREMFDYRSLEINAHANDQSLVVVVNRKSYMLNELGAGLAQFIIVLANVAVRAPALLLIDEPELNLHPALQQRFLLQLASYANEGVFFATHSVGLARATATRIFSFRKVGDAAEVGPFADTPHFAEFMGELSFSAFQELGYDRVLLVEGVTDAPVFRHFLRLLGYDQKTIVMPLGGNQLARGDVDIELAELKRLTPNIYAVVDSERSAAGAPAVPERVRFKEACERSKIPVLITERRATDNYLTERAIKLRFGDSQRGFQPFESRKDVNPSWSKDANWRIASLMTWDEIKDTDLGRFLIKYFPLRVKDFQE